LKCSERLASQLALNVEGFDQFIPSEKYVEAILKLFPFLANHIQSVYNAPLNIGGAESVIASA
jgi:hypothetical protein